LAPPSEVPPISFGECISTKSRDNKNSLYSWQTPDYNLNIA